MDKEYTLYELNKLIEFVEKQIKDNKADDYIIILKKLNRSLQYHRRYWSVVIPAIFSHLRDELSFYIKDKNVLHSKLIDDYTMFRFGANGFKKYIDIYGNKTYISKFSTRFDKCSQNEFEDYVNFVENNVNRWTYVDSIDLIL